MAPVKKQQENGGELTVMRSVYKWMWLVEILFFHVQQFFVVVFFPHSENGRFLSSAANIETDLVLTPFPPVLDASRPTFRRVDRSKNKTKQLARLITDSLENNGTQQ